MSAGRLSTTPAAWRRLWVLAAATWLFASGPRAAQAQAIITITDVPAPTVSFGEVIVFEASARSTGADLSGVTLHLQPAAQAAFSWHEVAFERGREITARATVTMSAAALPPFSSVAYWWEFEAEDGTRLESDPATFYYEDDRFDWQRLASGALTVHWYEGGPDFGQAALDTAIAAYSAANTDIRAPLPERLEIYVYASPRDAQAALQRVGVLWADGHADAALGVVIVVAAPDLSAGFNLQREIPHELTHILLYRATGEHYARVPVWLNEGLAMMNQAQPEPDFPALLAAARDGGRFLPLDSLCGSFPADLAQARLAYAQSESFTRYLRARFGAERLHALIQSYAGGAECSPGLEAALGQPLAALEQAWLAQVTNAGEAALRWQTVAPWLLLGGLVLLGPVVFFLLIARPMRRAG